MSELLSSFSKLFGPIDHAEGNESRSVLSPTAYLVDLLMLTENSGYHARRPDIGQIPLDQASTFTEIPQLEIANGVMGALAPPAELTSRSFPPPLPFSEQSLRLRLYAEKLGTSLDELQRLYASGVDGHLSARLLLGLSQEEYDLFSTAHDSDAGIAALWGATAAELSELRTGDVELIKKKLGVSMKELKSLVRQDLSAEELARAAGNPAERFFINQSTNYLVLFDDREPAQLRLKNDAGLTLQHLDRLMRLVRLARRLDLSFPELDWLLQTACRQGSQSLGITLDEDGLQALAVALGLRKLGDLEIDELCSAWGPVKSHGRGDGAAPFDLFSRVYDNGFPSTLAQLVQKLASSGAGADALDERLQATLRLPGADLLYLKGALSERGVAQPALVHAEVVAYFTAVRRVVRLSTLLSLDVRETVALLDVLGAQWTVSDDHELGVPAPFVAATTALSPLECLVQPDVPPREVLDVLQKIVRVKAWMDSRQLSARQLAFICLADHAAARAVLDDGSPIDDVQPNDAIEATLEDLHQSLLDMLVAPGALQTGSLTATGARAVFESLLAARVLVTFADPARALLRVPPLAPELAAAMQSGIQERLELHASDLAALGFSDIELLFSALVSHGYLERRDEVVDGEVEAHHFVAPGLAAFFADPNGAATFTLPNFQAQSEALFAALRQEIDAPRVAPSVLVAAGVESEDVNTLFGVLLARGHVVAVSGTAPVDYRVADEAKAFFQDVANLSRFVLPDFSAAFAALAAKVAAYQRANDSRVFESQELEGRLAAIAEQSTRLWLRTLSGFLALSEDLTELAAAWAFGTPDETLPQTLATAAEALFRAKVSGQRPLTDAYLGSRFCRLQQLSLLLRKTAMSADEARVYLDNQALHRRLPETLRVPAGFLDAGRVDALTTLPSGDFLIVSGLRYAAFDRVDYRPLDTGTLDQIPGVALSGSFRARVLAQGFDTAFSDTDASGNPVLHLSAGDAYVSVSAAGTSAPRPITDWGRVRNNIQQNERVDAAVQDPGGHLFLFSGDQYVRYDQPLELLAGPAAVDERYPKSIRGKFEAEGLTPLPAAMFSKVDAAFRDADDSYYFFSGNRFTHSGEPYQLREIRPVWGHVLNYLFEENRVDAAFVLGDATYLTRKNQLTRYTGPAYRIVDERFPITFGNIPESEPLLRVLRRFPSGLDAALAGSDGQLYAFANGHFASSAEPDTSLSIRERWGHVRNVFIDNQRVDGALFHAGVTYLFCGDQYVRYSTPSFEFVDEGYPKRVHANWNGVEHVGMLPATLPLPVTAVVVGRTPGGTTDDIYFFGGNRYAGPSGALEDIKAQWARVRNNIERVGIVDAALLDGSGRMYLFSGDQFYRYTSPETPFVDETYPRRLSGNWAQEGTGYSLPDAFASGISAALRAGDGRIFFFSGTSYARVDAAPAATPRPSAQDWGVVRNWVQSQNRVGAAFVDPSGNTYLFGGDQFVRYSSANYDVVDEGHPLAIGTRWGNLPESFRSGIDASLAFRSPVDNVQRLYLFKGGYYARYSTSNYAQVDAGYPKRLRDGISAEGHWFRGFALHDPDSHGHPDDWIEEVEATYVDTHNNQPRIFVFYNHGGATQWRREYRSGNWLDAVPMHRVDDYEPFTRLDAAFVAADGTLHAFSGDQYASRPRTGGHMTAPVPVRSRWARVRNQFAELSRVDACLSMADGRTYLFCATQYIKYTGALRPGQTDFYVDEGYPRRIEPNWPNEGVGVALVPEFQPTGYDLCRDAAGKIHFFNGTRYDFSGNAAGDVALSSRWGKVENRFHELDRVDGAYRAENGKLYLFCDTQFTRYSAALQPGSPEFYADEGYPRTVSIGWAGEGLQPAMPNTWNAEGSAVFRDTQQTYAFAGPSFISSQAAVPAPVIPQWAKVRNEIQTQSRVDAGFVHGQGAGAVTLLFGADQYVRYSGGYDGFVDEGYPKVIAHLADADGVFPGMPSELLTELHASFAGRDGNVHVFGAAPADAAVPQRHVSSASGSTLRPLNERWGIVDNQLWDDEFVNAALHTGDGKLFLFSGDQYLRYSGSDRTHVDEGYPRKISTSYAAELGVTALAPVMHDGVDAALIIGTTHFYFVGDEYVSSAEPATARPLVDQWGRVENHLQQNQQLDAAFVAPSGKLYLFAQNQYSVYSGASRDYVDEEFPRVLVSDIGAAWPQAPENFTQGLSAAAAFEGRSYLFKEGLHVRISDFRLRQPDAGYPRSNAEKFVERFDFELGRLPDAWRVKQLFDDYSAQSPTLLEYLDGLDLNDSSFDVAGIDPRVVALARATQWSSDAVRALLSRFGLTASDLLDARTLVRLARCFELADRVGSAPQKLASELWDRVFVPPPAPGQRSAQLEAAADFLYQLIKAATSTRDWIDVSRSLHDPVANAKRDALVAYLVENDPPNSDLQDGNDVYEHLLTDVQMDASLDTSRVVEAINSIQLFYHRALMRLETVPSGVEERLRRWWPWMKNYRIWEANRKVFLHPENYIRPELRREKSFAFEELEQKLLQDEITAISVQAGYQQYLEAFHEIARLRIVGGYRYGYVTGADGDDPATRTRYRAVFMIGVSRTDPPVYYYRFGALPETKLSEPVPKDDPINWEPWQKIGITIDSDRVQPVYAYNRLFLFWIETKPFNSTSFATASGNEYNADSEGTKQVKLTLKFSFYNFTKEWVAPQAVLLNPDDPIDAEALPHLFRAEAARNVVLTANNPVPQGGTDEDFIFLTFRFLFWEWKLGRLSDGLDLVPDASPGWRFKGLRFLGDQETPFPAHLGINPNDVTATVSWGEHSDSESGEWFSFDAKGGTFLCRPAADAPAVEEGEILGKRFDDVTAAFAASNEDVYVFTQPDRSDRSTLAFYRYDGSTGSAVWGSAIGPTDPAWPWGRLAGALQQDTSRRIQNVIVAAHDDTTFFLLGTSYFTYAGGAYDVTRENLVREFADGSPPLSALIGAGVPARSWNDVTASGRALVRAFRLPGEHQAVVVSRDGAGALSVTTVDLNQLRGASGAGGSSPFDGWDALDTVFQRTTPEPSVVFSRGDQLVIFTWSTRSWSAAVLAPLPGGAAGLSAAFSGLDGKLYFFVDDRYAEVDPLDLGASHTFRSVDPRWGRLPSLFSWLLKSVDGAVFGADDELYLFSGKYCLPCDAFDPDALDELVVHNAEGQLLTVEPPEVGQLWRTSSGNNAAINEVRSAFASNGRIYLSGKGPVFAGLLTGPMVARYSQDDQERPFQADDGYPIDFLFGGPTALPTDFYARLFASHAQTFSILRLTSNTSEGFSRELFAHGIPGLLSLATQRRPEVPRFTEHTGTGEPSRDELFVDPQYVTQYPGKGQDAPGLDFTSANAFYYWEIFFHIPFLIAQALKQGQRFEEALQWYEHVFDPTVPQDDDQYWKFLAFVDNATFTKEEDLSQLAPQLEAYRDDPFDPHAIAELRPMAYRKAFVMSYVDNLIAWGDLLFRQYTRESIGEGTMLYVRAADILGKRPEELGKRVMSPTATYGDLVPPPNLIAITDEILQLENGVPPISRYHDTWPVPNDTLFNAYFYIPENEEFVSYWNKLEDRLSKIRHGLNIDGVKQSLALFAPPVDVFALVQAFASGGGLAQALADYNTPVPHYRFAFMLGRARELTARLTGLGGALLAALEKKDAEELNLLRNTHERQILEMQLEVKKQQLEGAKQSLLALQEGLKNAQARESHYQQLIAVGLSAHEQTQIAGMIIGQAFSQVSNVLGAAASVASYVPQAGSPFAMTYGGIQIGGGVLALSHAFKAQADIASFQSTLAATLGGWERRSQEWQLQKTLATGDTLQVGRQIRAAEIQVDVANQEAQIQRRLIKNNQSIDTFMNSKFTTKQLYQFMIGRLSAVYFQTYHLALHYAKGAQRALQFELALPESEVKYIGAAYWDSLKKGLLAGEQLQLDIDRLESAHLEANARRLEITRHVSLLQVDPLALLRLQQQGQCEFELTEALFDTDFPGHYCRQIKTISLSFPAVVGPYHNFNATLTQLGHRTLLAPDKKALSYLLGRSTDEPSPSTLRVDWRPNQQVALSTGVNDSGLFQVNYSDERYLPFEGTGAVSTWRLEVNGVNGLITRQTLSDVIITTQYTALQGGSAFAETVKSAIGNASSERVWLLNLAADYSDAWQAFMSDPTAGMTFSVDRRNLPHASERRVTGLYLHYELTTDPDDDLSRQAITLTAGQSSIQLKPGGFKSGLSLPLLEQGQNPANVIWRLSAPSASAASKFNPRNLRTISLAVTYQSKPRF